MREKLHFYFALMPLIAYSTHAHSAEITNRPSSNAYGNIGLILSPTARHDKNGTLRINMASSKSYIHTSLGLQIADPLYINLRQTFETSSPFQKAKHLTPGIDMKYRLFKETYYLPEISLGMNSFLGHKKQSSEYIAFSKYKNNFDFTAGISWGRSANKFSIKNPLKKLSNHFNKNRVFTNEESNSYNNWFTGENAGIFAGIEYHTPIEGLSIKAELNGEDYAPEKESSNFNEPPPWAIGLNYAPNNWSNFAISTIGGEKITGRISIDTQIDKWVGRSHKPSKSSLPHKIAIDNTTINEYNLNTHLYLSNIYSAHEQIKQAAISFANQSDDLFPYTELKIKKYALQGPTIIIPTKLIIKSKNNKIISPQEIWRKIEINNSKDQFKAEETKSILGISAKELIYNKQKTEWKFILENKLSLSEENSGVLYRSSLMAELIKPLTNTMLIKITPRLNIHDNLHNIHKNTPRNIFSIEKNEDLFADTRISIENLNISWLRTIFKDTHLGFHAGWLEEKYAGAGAEILYRPYGKRLAIGAETFVDFKRDPTSKLNIKLIERSIGYTAHINLYYEIPKSDMTIKTSLGKYLEGDLGGGIELSKTFRNGTKLKAYATLTNQPFFNIFGRTTNLNHGINLSFPIGNIKYIKEGSHIDFITAPIGRDIGQRLSIPIPLYETTESLSSRHLSNNWNDIIQ